MNRNSAKYDGHSIRFSDLPDSNRPENLTKSDEHGTYHCKKTANNNRFGTTSEEKPHSSTDSDHFFKKNQSIKVKNSYAVSNEVIPQDGIIEVEDMLPCVDKSKHGDEDSECCKSHKKDNRKRLGFWEIFRNAISRIFDDISALVNGREQDSDGEDVEYGPVRFVPHSLSILVENTYFTKEELKTMYRTFKNECPTGVLYEDMFKTIFSQFFPSGDTNMYAHYLFNALDNGQKGYISFEEFVTSLSSLLRGSLEEKLEWIFRIYDISRLGRIKKEDIESVLKSVYAMRPKKGDEIISQELHVEHAIRVYTKLDANDVGAVNYTMFLEACSRDPSIIASMKIFEEDG